MPCDLYHCLERPAAPADDGGEGLSVGNNFQEHTATTIKYLDLLVARQVGQDNINTDITLLAVRPDFIKIELATWIQKVSHL